MRREVHKTTLTGPLHAAREGCFVRFAQRTPHRAEGDDSIKILPHPPSPPCAMRMQGNQAQITSPLRVCGSRWGAGALRSVI